MRPQVRFFASLAAVAVLAVCVGSRALAQSSSSSVLNTANYVPSDPLAGVRYDNRYDLSVGMAYRHMKAGPNLLQGANLGGLDISGSMWLLKHWALEATGRGYLGTSGAAPNIMGVRGPFLQEYIFAAGPEWLGPHNKHGDLMAHVLVGGIYGIFEGDLHPSTLVPNPVQAVGFYNNQVSPVEIIGGHVDLNRSARWVFRVTPDAILTHYGTNYGAKITQYDINFAISVGMEYKFQKRR